ncbi:c-type cytochrome [Stigmatella hybrida]|uniref:c-type cytochrome n=1 Tax=Stigmatella hybrida TaxID=394097 RepID=UPI001CDAB93E|nr:cytochrome c [Stigmatella hybrida]
MPTLPVRPTVALLGLLSLTACEREQRRFQELAPASGPVDSSAQLTELQPGTPSPRTPTKNVYEENAYALSEGKRLYNQFNCAGCHAQGGGDIGPPLMDSKWRYGSEPENIHASIVQGRPNGMPAFRGKLVDQQVWQLVAYVRSLSGLVRMDVAPSRGDSLSAKPPEALQPEQPPTPEPVEQPR